MTRASQNGRGILLMLAAMAFFGANDAVVKLVTERVPLFQALAIRGCFLFLLLGAIALWRGGIPLRVARGDRRVLVLRSLGEVLATLLFLSALVRMPFANVVAIMQSLPITMTLLGAWIFGESIGWRRGLASGVGFLGVMLIVQPGAEGFSVWSLVTVGAMLAVALRDLSSRALSEATIGLTITFWSAVSVMGLALGGMAFEGTVPVSAGQVAALAASAVFIMLAFQLVIAASRCGEIAVVAPFRYSAMLWGLLLGWSVFGQLPNALTLAGAGVVVGSGLFMLWRERALAARAERLSGLPPAPAGQGGAVDNPPDSSYTAPTRGTGVTLSAGIAAGSSRRSQI
ncbi:DMT family transporter [Frigidibacter sp. MR17.14]|uniref:DMT family transporter n=1 Tax=Frigidibacter sp. MR17.14 TaxID=3126509 RepID=UPI003012E6B6